MSAPMPKSKPMSTFFLSLPTSMWSIALALTCTPSPPPAESDPETSILLNVIRFLTSRNLLKKAKTPLFSRSTSSLTRVALKS